MFECDAWKGDGRLRKEIEKEERESASMIRDWIREDRKGIIFRSWYRLSWLEGKLYMELEI